MVAFKIGDMVVGNVNNGYTLTNENCLLRILEVYEDTERMTCELVNHSEKKYAKVKGQRVEDLPMSDFHIASVDELAAFEPKKREAKEKAMDTYKFRAGLVIKTYPDNRLESTFNTSRNQIQETDSDRLVALNKIIESVKGKSAKEVYDTSLPNMITGDPDLAIFEDIAGKSAVKNGLAKMINFFKEFQFEPSFRSVNTIAWKGESGKIDDLKDYVSNYFRVTGNQKADAVIDKMKSPEFKEILTNISLSIPNEKINRRFKIYYGSQGTGKTTLAMEESEGRCCLCNGGILPADLLEDFSFNDGKPGFQGSLLRECMEEGKIVVLDEFNLLPFETVRFLQGILDGKKQFTYKGETIKIKDGFEIIATMNLTVNGMVFGLPEPLVDRAYDIREFVLTADNLMSALV